MSRLHPARLTPKQREERTSRLTAGLREHQVGPATGGTATGSRWTCICGETGLTGGTRDVADALGRAHVAKALAKLLDMSPDQFDRHIRDLYRVRAGR